MLYDTGACTSVISEVLLQQIQKRLPLERSGRKPLRLLGADGGVLQTVGLFRIPLTILGHTKEVDVHAV